MAEYFGNSHLISVQKSIRARMADIAAEPLIANGGRVLNILAPDAYGWDKVRDDVARDGFVALTMVDKDETLIRLATEFEHGYEFPFWTAFTGNSDQVMSTCRDIIAGFDLPDDWTILSTSHPSETLIDQSQQLNLATGVAPTPAYYLRGHEVPSMLTCLLDGGGELVACATGAMRYHRDGPLSGWLFAGAVSVSPDHRRKGLGVFVNAALLRDSHSEFAWVCVLEQAKADNAASIGMIKRCGLAHRKNCVTIVVNKIGHYLTR